MHDKDYNNKWRGFTVSLRTGGQGRPTSIPIPNHAQTYTKSIWNTGFSTFRLDDPGPMDEPMDGPTDGRTKPLTELCVHN